MIHGRNDGFLALFRRMYVKRTPSTPPVHLILFVLLVTVAVCPTFLELQWCSRKVGQHCPGDDRRGLPNSES
jgi:hypothetical protein